MTADNGGLTEKFSAAAETSALLHDLENLYFSGVDVEYEDVLTVEEGERLKALCIRTVQNQQRQDVLIARQATLIAGLQERLASVESEFNPQRPLRGKDDLKPQPPSR